MQIVSTFLGERRRAREVTTLEGIEEASAEFPLGDGWGQIVEGTPAELLSVGGHEVGPGAWVLPMQGGYLCAEVP